MLSAFRSRRPRRQRLRVQSIVFASLLVVYGLVAVFWPSESPATLALHGASHRRMLSTDELTFKQPSNYTCSGTCKCPKGEFCFKRFSTNTSCVLNGYCSSVENAVYLNGPVVGAESRGAVMYETDNSPKAGSSVTSYRGFAAQLKTAGSYCCYTSGDCPSGYSCYENTCYLHNPYHEYACALDETMMFKDVFTCAQKRSGAFLLHAIGVFWMFLALAIVCDDFFVPALEELVERWSIKEDVAGATFMAAGGSAPELFTSIIGVFGAESDVGFGTIVGSAVFNILLVIGACSLACPEPLPLTWFPLARDSLFYSVAILILFVFVTNDNGLVEGDLTAKDQRDFDSGKMQRTAAGTPAVTAIVWWEALVLLCIYICYVVFMKFNERVEEWTKAKVKAVKEGRQKRKAAVSPTATPQYNKDKALSSAAAAAAEAIAKAQEEETPKTPGTGEDTEEEDKDGKIEVGSIKAAALMTKLRRGTLKDKLKLAAKITVEHARIKTVKRSRRQMMELAKKEEKEKAVEQADSGGDGEDDDEDENPLAWPSDWKKNGVLKGIFSVFWWAYQWPLYAVLLIVPDCRKPHLKKYYLLSFFMSILCIAGFSLFMVSWATELCYALQIPVPVMGFTILAAGTSVPDLLTSMFVAQRGLGDMAVSSSIGSNIFDLCMGLPLPWLISTGIVKPAQNSEKTPYVRIYSDGIVFSLLMLFGLLAVTILAIIMFKWKISKPMGIFCFVNYAIFVTVSLLAEYDFISVKGAVTACS